MPWRVFMLKPMGDEGYPIRFAPNGLAYRIGPYITSDRAIACGAAIAFAVGSRVF